MFNLKIVIIYVTYLVCTGIAVTVTNSVFDTQLGHYNLISSVALYLAVGNTFKEEDE